MPPLTGLHRFADDGLQRFRAYGASPLAHAVFNSAGFCLPRFYDETFCWFQNATLII
jgi:hypothetical protein